jgi:tRNA 2-thiouridine synthesizing protein A
VDERTLDCRGLRCPMPIVRISQEFKTMPVGGRLRVEASDPAFKADLHAWARRLHHIVVSFSDGDVKQALIEKAPEVPRG